MKFRNIEYKFLFIFLLLSINFNLKSQKIDWKVGMNYFFDNNEFEFSKFTKDQTMTGVHFTPEMSLSFDSIQGIHIGTDFLKTSGSKHYMDDVQAIVYYQYQLKKFVFYAGSFPRTELLSNYSDLFFQDSVKFYKPTMQGIFMQLGSEKSFFNLWLDWTGHQTATDRETFFVGASGHRQMHRFFTDFESYMFHYATVRPYREDYGVSDNFLAHLSLGLNFSNKQGLDTLLFAVGALGGYERDRKFTKKAEIPVGVVFRANAEYKGLGTQNMLYIGDPRMVYYNKYKNELYWNNPFLRSNRYLESQWYYKIIRSQFVQAKIALKFHFSDGRLFTEQAFTLNATLDKLSGKNKVRR